MPDSDVRNLLGDVALMLEHCGPITIWVHEGIVRIEAGKHGRTCVESNTLEAALRLLVAIGPLTPEAA